MKCLRCGGEYNIKEKEREYYLQEEIPYPDMCHRCKFISMMAYFNVRFLYQRKCEITGKRLITSYDPESPQKVIDRDYWYSNEFDALSYGRDYDFSRYFFPQVMEFFNSVPIYHNMVLTSENCDYCNGVISCRNCYILFDAYDCQDVYYSYGAENSNDCIDCAFCFTSQYCYECVYVENCYKVFYSVYSQDCSDSYFLADCQGCSHCFFCVGLKNQKYCIFNEQYSKEEYFEKLKEYNMNKRSSIEELKERFVEYQSQHGFDLNHKIENCENSTGGFLKNDKNCTDCFMLLGSEDCQNCSGQRQNSCIDTFAASAEKSYHSMGGFSMYNIKFSLGIFNSSNCEYSMFLENCEECFACFGLQYKKHCIMNKQYSPEEYFELKEKIKSQMKENGEYGRFFPVEYSPVPVNNSRAIDVFGKLDLDNIGGRRYEKGAEVDSESAVSPEDDINNVDDSVLEKVLLGKHNKPFRVIRQELDFYKKFGIPLPDRHFDYRLHNLLSYIDYDKVFLD